jgi:hypothetical protein
MHGATARQQKGTEYGLQLREKQNTTQKIKKMSNTDPTKNTTQS